MMGITLLTKDKKLNALLILTYLAYISLLALFTVGYMNNEQHSLALWLLQCLPLLILLPGLVKQYYRAHSVLCFVIMAYFTAYVVEASSDIAQASDWLGLSLSVIIFTGAMFSSRGLQRLQAQQSTP